MLVMDPDTLEKTRFETDARMFYTEKELYVGVFMEQPQRLSLQGSRVETSS